MPAQRKRLAKWYCINTHPLQEGHVQRQVNSLGYATELFTFQNNNKERVLFPGYLFVSFSINTDHWRKLWSLPGVKRIFSSSPQAPIAVPGYLFDIVRAELARVFGPAPAPPAELFTEGAEVTLLKGAFRQFNGICGLRDKDRIQVMLSILGRQTTIELPISDIELVKAKAA